MLKTAYRIASLVFSVLLGAALSACSSTETVAQSNCGPGTTLRDGQCVVDDDASLPDIGFPTDSQSVEISVGDAGDVGDAAEAETASLDEPCPSLEKDEQLLSCDSACNPTPLQAGDKCGMKCDSLDMNYAPPDGSSAIRVFLRTPPPSELSSFGCSACSKKYFGIQMQFNRPNSMTQEAFRVRVKAPYFIAPPPCPFSESAKLGNCYIFPKSTLPERVMILTEDPSAPIRNVEVDYGRDTCP